MNEKVQEELQAEIERFAGNVTAILQSAVADALADALGAVKTPRVATTGGKKKVTKKTSAKRVARNKGQKRSRKDLERLTSKLLTQVGKADGQSIEELGKAMKMPTKELKLPMQKLLDAKQVKKKGRLRATRYSAA